MIGHAAVRAYLERQLPAATLLHGPASIGKWALARHLAEYHSVHPIDRWDVPYGLTIETVRLVTTYTRSAPQGPFKLIVARLDGSSRPALNALLKTLEEPPERVKFLLTSTDRSLPTVASRCNVFELGILSSSELEQVYSINGYSPPKARRAAAFARGQVDQGYEVDSNEGGKGQVCALAKAITSHDQVLFQSAFHTWDQRTTQLFGTLLVECLTRRWHVFSEDDVAGLDRDRARLLQMTAAITRIQTSRPRLGIRTALEPFAAGV